MTLVRLDPLHEALDLFDQEITQDVWKEKYRYENEEHPRQSHIRVCKGVYAKDKSDSWMTPYDLMRQGIWMPAGRIHAGAGTPKVVTWINCYVTRTIEDSMDGIADALKDGMLTMQQGGGIGVDFSTLRPEWAHLERTGSAASGPLPFMDMWNAMCGTIMSAGSRRGAMMGAMADWHPDIIKFIRAKHEKGRLTNFNVSVLVSDNFLEAVKKGHVWDLGFGVKPSGRDPINVLERDGKPWYVYQRIPAVELWDIITRSTYEYSEPGVIFIDRINDLNNLKYCEHIAAPNPCVTGDTLILTDQGHLPIRSLVGKLTKVWNGEEWSEVTPFSTGINELLEVTFVNGAVVKCTPYHKWKLDTNSVVKARDLQVSSKLVKGFRMPTLDLPKGNDPKIDAYSQGFYCGDGTRNATVSSVYKPSYSVIPRLVGRCWKEQSNKAGTLRKWNHGWMLAKDFVPTNASIEYCVNWLAGYLDADGNLGYPQGKGKGVPIVQASAKDPIFLGKIRLMLTRLGVNCRIWIRKDAGMKVASGTGRSYYCEPTTQLMINSKGTYDLVQLGLRTNRLDLNWVEEPQGRAERGLEVVSITSSGKEETFCFTEPKRSMGVFNGVPAQQCGEQPLPPNGACDLGAINLARLVKNPFAPDAWFDFDSLKRVVPVAVRFLDNVIDTTPYPLEAQKAEELSKRRIGLGHSGLANALAQLQLRYGTREAANTTRSIMGHIAHWAYDASVDLAKERGAFPAYTDEFQKSPFVKRLPQDLQMRIKVQGIRNGVLLTVAPTGTTSLYYGNISSGLEPVFDFIVKRKVLQPDGSFKEYTVVDYGYRLFRSIYGDDEALPDYMVTVKDLTVEDHLRMQAACQEWIDAAVSKTINCPADMPFEDFQEVYQMAYDMGCKSCTTYRPSATRGSVLESVEVGTDVIVAGDTPHAEALPFQTLSKRPDVLHGTTYKVRWPSVDSALYVTINEVNGRPFEIFIASRTSKYAEWVTALTLMISAIMRREENIDFVFEELKRIVSPSDSAYIDGKFYGSLVARIGEVLEYHVKGKPEIQGAATFDATPLSPQDFDLCPRCNMPALIRQEGCGVCTQCGFNSCE